MAADQRLEASGGLGFYSLTGYLQLHERRGLIIGKDTLVRYWFWFDDKTCELKYYKKKDQFQQFLLNPLGRIDMRYARVTPSTASHSQGDIVRGCPPSKDFVIVTEAHTYVLAASSNEEAHGWIKKLQDKRGQWMKSKGKSKASSRSIPVDAARPVGLLTEGASGSSRVRKILSKQLKDPHVAKRESYSAPEDFDPFADDDDGLRPRTTTAPPLSSSQPSHSLEDKEEMEDKGEEQVDAPNVDTAAIPAVPVIQGHSEELGILTSQERQILELRQELGETRQEKDRLNRHVLDLQEEVETVSKENAALQNELAELKETLHKLKGPNSSLKQENDMLRGVIQQNLRDLQSVNNEMNLHTQLEKERDLQIEAEKQRVAELEKELLHFKAKYVLLLNLAFKINPPSPAGLGVEDYDPDEEKPRECLLQLIKSESSPDNPLMLDTKFEDDYGELHDWSDSNIHHFLCRQLYLHFTETEQECAVTEWTQYLKQFKIVNGRFWDIPVEGGRNKRRELRNLLRRGIPRQYRCQLWGSLVNCWVGRLRELKNSTAVSGLSYYQSLIKPGTNFTFEKQIRLDVYRTLPSNKHFKQNGKGLDKLLRVLLAYSQHNQNVGYCQGMNMIAAIGLLFLDEETTFWFMVTIIEKLMPKNYYTCGLAAAQADQLVLKDLVSEKLPVLSGHLDANSIDVTVVTFNWFLTLFIDALPTESLLRVLDSFLLEGRKIFFRIALAILKLNDRRILHMTDPVTIFQFIKEITRHIFDVNELFQVAFCQLKPFMSRKELQSRCAPHLTNAMDDWSRRERQRMKMASNRSSAQAGSALLASISGPQRKNLQWECGCVVSTEEVWLCCGERMMGRICVVQTSEIGFDMTSPHFDAKSRILCMKHIPTGFVIVGTLDHTVHAIDLTTRKEVWSLKLNDSVLDVAGMDDGTLFCAVADGSLAVIQTEGEVVSFSDPLLYRVGSTSVNCVLLTPCQHVWCGCYKSITVYSAISCEPINTIVTSDRVYKMENGTHGVWVTYRSSTMLTLYDTRHMVKLLNVDYTTLLNQPDGPGHSRLDYRITTITSLGNLLWIGTGNASIHLFSVGAIVASPEESIRQIATANKEHTQKVLQGLTLPSPSSTMSLVGGEQILEMGVEVEDESSVNADQQDERSSRDSYTMPRRFHKRPTFGRTFRKEKIRDGLRKEAGIYQLKHQVSKCVVPEAPDSHRFSVIIPIRRKENQYVISCVNCSTDSERGVQLWQCPQSAPTSHWSFSYIPACYEAVSYTPPPPPTTITRGRTYSTVVGATSLDDSLARSSSSTSSAFTKS